MTRSTMRLMLSAALATLGTTMTMLHAADGWRPLFDGKTTNGWRGFRQDKMPDGWKVVDGALTRVGKAGDIITVDQFDDFELSLEWKIAPGGNSGVFYRVTEEDDAMWKTAPEMQVLDDAGYKEKLKPTQTSGSNYDLHAPSRSVARPAGSWNESRILVNGNHVEHWLNGVTIVEYELGSAEWERLVKASKFGVHPRYGRARSGHIGLQDHGDEVAFRNIKIRALK
jgi:hypothetical protein